MDGSEGRGNEKEYAKFSNSMERHIVALLLHFPNPAMILAGSRIRAFRKVKSPSTVIPIRRNGSIRSQING